MAPARPERRAAGWRRAPGAGAGAASATVAAVRSMTSRVAVSSCCVDALNDENRDPRSTAIVVASASRTAWTMPCAAVWAGRIRPLAAMSSRSASNLIVMRSLSCDTALPARGAASTVRRPPVPTAS